MFSIPAGRLLVAGIVASFVGIGGLMIGPVVKAPEADLHLEPPRGTVLINDTLEVDLVVKSNTPVNVFSGELLFDSAVLKIKTIDYNLSIADLWTERPWFSNGEGTLNFTGGTTRSGGFSGEGTLITVVFQTKTPGETLITMRDVRILRHDGLGSDADVGNPIDAVFLVEEEVLKRETVFDRKLSTGPKVTVLQEKPSPDLNNDGKQDLLDISIFMSHLATQNKRSDFNLDGKVNLADLSILNN